MNELINSIPAISMYDWDSEINDVITVYIKPLAFERDGMLCVSAENGDGFADYYGEFRGGTPFIHPDLEKWAADHGGYWEWENPGCIIFVK